MGKSFGKIVQSMKRRHSGTFIEAVTKSPKKFQIYISSSLDPYLNLSIENFFLQKTPDESTVLFLYSNRPSIILGRNQNPWNEVNLRLMRQSRLQLQLVRRRSGGGTVFHDEGNVNFSVIYPTAEFNRDKYANMVVQALQSLGPKNVRVNERHDIVLDQIDKTTKSKVSYKISGSAYKLTRTRSLHHGTCLLCCKRLKLIPSLLKSPAKSFIEAKGVESVSSQVTNIGLTPTDFRSAVIKQFISMHSYVTAGSVDKYLEDIPEIQQGISEMKSNEWIYGQTPQFKFVLDGSSEYPIGSGKTISQTYSLPDSLHVEFTARHGRIVEAPGPLNYLVNQNLHKITDWRPKVSPNTLSSSSEIQKKVGSVLNDLFL